MTDNAYNLRSGRRDTNAMNVGLLVTEETSDSIEGSEMFTFDLKELMKMQLKMAQLESEKQRLALETERVRSESNAPGNALVCRASADEDCRSH